MTKDVDSGSRTVDCGLWTVDQETMERGLRTVESKPGMIKNLHLSKTVNIFNILR